MVRIVTGDDPRDISDDAAVLYDILHDVNYNLGRIATVAEAWAAPRTRVVRPDLEDGRPRYFIMDGEGLVGALAIGFHDVGLGCENYPEGHTDEAHESAAAELVEALR